MEKDIREIIKKGGTFLSVRVIGLLAGYLFTFFIAKQYGAGVNGLVALSFSLFSFISVFGRMGIDINLVNVYANGEDVESNSGLFFKSLIKSIVFSSFLSILLYLFRDTISVDIFEKPQLGPYIFWVSLSIPFWVITFICAGFLRARRLTVWYAFLDSPGRFGFSLVAFLLFIITNDNPINAIKAHFYGVLILAIVALTVSIYNIKRISFNTTYNSWVFLKESFPMMMSGIAIVSLGWIDTFILGIFETDDNVGIYNVSLKIAALTAFSLHAIDAILMPKFTASYRQNDQIQCSKLIAFSTRLNFYITVLIITFIVIFHKWVLGVFGEEFIEGSTVLLILCIGQLVNSFTGSVGVVLQTTGNQKIFQNIVLIALGMNLILNIILTPLYGFIGTAIATVISISTWNILGVIIIKRKLNLTMYYTPGFLKK